LELIPADDHGHEALRSTLLRETQHRGFVGRILLQNNNLAALGGRRDVPSAVYVDGILKGAKPGGLPVQAPTKFQLVVNLKNHEGARPHPTTNTACHCRRIHGL